MSGLLTATPLFVGPLAFVVGLALVILLVLLVGRLVLGVAWRLVVIAAVVLGVLWLLGALGTGPPAFG